MTSSGAGGRCSWWRRSFSYSNVRRHGLNLVEVDDANLPGELASGIRAVLAPAVQDEIRLSALLNAARAQPGPARLLDTIWAACLWVWVSDNVVDEDAQPADSGLSDLLAGLVATDDGKPLADSEFGGPDLLIGPATRRAAMEIGQ
jgi:hypothetical protein